MAMSLGVVSSFLAGESSFAKSLLPASSFRLSSHANLRMVTSAAAASPNPPATATGKRGPRGIMKPRRISPEMQNFLGVPEIPRTQALKQIWAYIKQHNLQDPENKKIIVCDEKLRSIFGGKERVGFLEVAGLISPHFLK